MFELIMFEKKKYSKSVRHIPHIISYFRLKKKKKKEDICFMWAGTDHFTNTNKYLVPGEVMSVL